MVGFSTARRVISTSATRLGQRHKQLASASLLRSSCMLNNTRAFSTASSEGKPTSLNVFSDEEKMMREAAARFANERVRPLVRQMDESEKMDPGVIKDMFDNGFMGIEVPTTHSGAGANFTSAIIVVDELSKVDPSVAVACDVHNTLAVAVVNIHANEELKKKYLPDMSTKALSSFCLTESGAGSDAFALKMRAEKDGDSYVLNGHKMWITNSGEAEIFVVFANLDPSKGYKGITAFVVEKGMGVQVAKTEKKLGIKSSSTCVLNFENVRVPKSNLLGKEGLGYKYAIEILNEGRVGIAAQMIGLAQGALEATLPYLFERKQFGTQIGKFQGMEFQYAQMATEIEAARLMTYNAARLKEEGKPFAKEAAMAKLFASQVAHKVASGCVELLGGVGFTRDLPVEKFYRDCKIGAIYEGTSNIQLQTIAKMLQKEHNLK